MNPLQFLWLKWFYGRMSFWKWGVCGAGKSYLCGRRRNPVGETSSPKLSRKRPLRHASCLSYVRASLRAGVAPSLAGPCSWGVRWSAVRSLSGSFLATSSLTWQPLPSLLLRPAARVFSLGYRPASRVRPRSATDGCGRGAPRSCAFGGWKRWCPPPPSL